MIIAAALAASFGPILFPVNPIAEEVQAGARLARREPGIGIEWLLGEADPRLDIDIVMDFERRTLGTWSDGALPQAVESATWLSPRLISRWLGFLQAREYWADGELESRWDGLREYLNGRVVWVVVLSAFPFQGNPINEAYAPPRLTDHYDLRFVATVDDAAVPVSWSLLASLRTQERSKLDGYRWWLELPFADLLAPEFKTDFEQSFYPLGDYHRSWHLVWCEATPVMVDGFELRVLSERKERSAHWGPAGNDVERGPHRPPIRGIGSR